MIDPAAETRRWKQTTAWTCVIVFENRVEMPLAVFDSLNDYSLSLPSGTFVGKRWRRHNDRAWWMGEYVDDPDPDRIGIIWRPIYFGPGLPATDANVNKVRDAAETASVLAAAR